MVGGGGGVLFCVFCWRTVAQPPDRGSSRYHWQKKTKINGIQCWLYTDKTAVVVCVFFIPTSSLYPPLSRISVFSGSLPH